ncbi:hypothetical protein B0H13DRAFT_1898490 [Mycena leptocephala]|nr:hypothetical protein B0H13DRAFT_1898490 [Mycena leptocephala]
MTNPVKDEAENPFLDSDSQDEELEAENARLRKELESKQALLHLQRDIMKGLREERRALERALLEETPARAQGEFAFKLEGTIAPQGEPKGKQNVAKDKSKERRPAEQGLTIQQKKDLASQIGKLKGARLEKVIRIIHEGVPDIKDAKEEIELEIDEIPTTST